VYRAAVAGGTNGGWAGEAAFTDGARVLVVLTDWNLGRSALVALDLTDGHVRWQTEPASVEGRSWTMPFQGRLVRMDETELVGLG
jgi:outer membrane protein assembly factor BamB